MAESELLQGEAAGEEDAAGEDSPDGGGPPE
jgi:hypothetical protein